MMVIINYEIKIGIRFFYLVTIINSSYINKINEALIFLFILFNYYTHRFL
jgi:phosphoribulokinase